MFYVVDKQNNNKFSIMDTSDGTVDVCDDMFIKDCILNKGIRIYGIVLDSHNVVTHIGSYSYNNELMLLLERMYQHGVGALLKGITPQNATLYLSKQFNKSVAFCRDLIVFILKFKGLKQQLDLIMINMTRIYKININY